MQLRAKRTVRVPKLTHQRLISVLDYNPDTGAFTWRYAANPRAIIGDEAGCADSQGYTRIMLDKEIFLGHRLAWFYINKEWPVESVKHINGKGDDNRLCNLTLRGKPERRADNAPVTQKELHRLFDYDQNSGRLRWKVSLSNRIRIGELAGVVPRIGYRYIRIEGRQYLAHRLIWMFVHGYWPPNLIDHINGKRDDNRLANLRLATVSQNTANSPLRSTNKSGFKGVSWSAGKKRWVARLMHESRLYILGYFDTPEKASAAYNEAAQRIHGEFANILSKMSVNPLEVTE